MLNQRCDLEGGRTNEGGGKQIEPMRGFGSPSDGWPLVPCAGNARPWQETRSLHCNGKRPGACPLPQPLPLPLPWEGRRPQSTQSTIFAVSNPCNESGLASKSPERGRAGQGGNVLCWRSTLAPCLITTHSPLTPKPRTHSSPLTP